MSKLLQYVDNFLNYEHGCQVPIPNQVPPIDPHLLARIVEECVRKIIHQNSLIKLPHEILNTLDDFADYNLNTRNVRQSTSNSYIADIRAFTKFITRTFQRVALTSDLAPEMLRDFVIAGRKAQKAETTLSRQCQGIITYSEFAYDKKFIDSPLTLKKAKVRFKKRFKEQPRISEKSFGLLMQTDFKISDPLSIRNWAFLNFLFYTDLAITVALSLKRSAINLATKKILIRDRSFSLPEQLIVILKKYIDESTLPDAPLFPSYSGRHICPSNYRELIFKPALKRIEPAYKFRSCHPRDLLKEVREKLLAIPTL